MQNMHMAIDELDRKKLLSEDEKNIRERIIEAQGKIIAAIQNTLKIKEDRKIQDKKGCLEYLLANHSLGNLGFLGN